MLTYKAEGRGEKGERVQKDGEVVQSPEKDLGGTDRGGLARCGRKATERSGGIMGGRKERQSRGVWGPARGGGRRGGISELGRLPKQKKKPPRRQEIHDGC